MLALSWVSPLLEFLLSGIPLDVTPPFSKFSCSYPSRHPIQRWNSEKILDTRVQHCLWVEGRGWTCVNWKNAPEMQKCPKTFVHDCSYVRGHWCLFLLLCRGHCCWLSNCSERCVQLACQANGWKRHQT